MDDLYTIEDVKKQHLSVIEGNVYDLVEFSQYHPGGEDILLHVGINATPHFHINHPFMKTNILYEKLSKYYKGKYLEEGKDCADYYEYDNEFSRELLFTVHNYFKDKTIYATNYSYFKILVILLAYFISSYYFISQTSYFNSFLRGLCTYLVALCIMHTANHGGFSSNPQVNKILGLSMNLLGSDRIWWMGHNVGHHAFTSVFKCDPDESNTQPILNFNPHSHILRNKMQKIISFIIFLLFIFVYPFINLFNPDHFYHKNKDQTVKIVRKQFWITIIFKILNIFSYIYILYNCGVIQGTKYILLSSYIIGLFIVLPFELSHHFIGNPKNINIIKEGKIIKKNWYSEQIQASCDYGGDISNMLSGGLSSQTVHHLFPRMNHDNYTALRKIIKPICAQYNIRYTHYPTIIDNIYSTFKYFYEL